MPLNTLTNGLKVATGATGDGGVALNDNFTALDAVKGKVDALNSAPTTVADAAERKAIANGIVGVTRIIQADLPGILWNLVAADATLDASWIGLPYTTDPDGDVVVSMQLASSYGIVPDANVLGQINGVPTIGDGVTSGGNSLAMASSGNEITFFATNSTGAVTSKHIVGTFAAADLVVVPQYCYIGRAVTSIGLDAFKNETNLTSVFIPDSVTSLGNGAFQNCSLTEINLPSSITSMGVSALAGNDFTSITLPPGITAIAEQLLNNCDLLTSVDVPEGVTSIGNSAFSGCAVLTSVTMPSTLVTVGANAFSSSPFITSLVFPEGVTTIGASVAASSAGILSVTLPSTLTSLGDTGFLLCGNLATVNCYATKTVIDTAPNGFAATASPLTIHARASDGTWTAGTGLSVGGNTNVTVIKDL